MLKLETLKINIILFIFNTKQIWNIKCASYILFLHSLSLDENITRTQIYIYIYIRYVEFFLFLNVF